MKSDIIDKLDFEEIDARLFEGDFLQQIMNTARALKPNTGLKLIQSFEPLPLINVLKDRKSTRLNSSHIPLSRMPSSA